MNGKRYGFSGSRSIPAGRESIIDGVLAILHGAEFTTGACMGVDAYVGMKLWRDHPEALHRIVVPADRSRVEYWWTHRAIRDAGPQSGVLLEEMMPGMSYADRNQRIVQHSDVLVAFPAHPETDPRSKRSGTWQTVRMARRAGLDVLVAVLDESEEDRDGR